MKKSTIHFAILVLAIIACTILVSDGLTYLITSLMALVIMGAVRRNSSTGIKITRWAKSNPKRAQVLITVLQLILMALGIFAGNNSKELGYEFSNTTVFVFSTISVIGFLSVPFLPKRSTIAIPIVVNRRRSAYMGIALSSFVMMVVFGNRISSDYPNSPIAHTVRTIDQAIFPDNSAADPDDEAIEPPYERNYGQALADGSSGNVAVFAVFTIPDKEAMTSSTLSKNEAREQLKAEKKAFRLEKKRTRMMKLLKHRLAAEGGSAALAVLLIILLLFPLCAGICLIFGGFGDATAGSIILGAILTGGSVWGIIAASRMGRKRKNKTEP